MLSNGNILRWVWQLMRAKQSICFRQAETCGVLILGLRPITILLTQSRNLFILAPPLQPKMMSAWRSNEGSLLPTACYYGLTGQLNNTDLSRTTKLMVFSFLPKNVHFISKNAISCLFLKNVSPSKRVICFILNNLHFQMVEGI